MKEKLLELISLELNDTKTLKFYDTWWYGDDNPAKNYQQVIKTETNKPSVYQDFKSLRFTLKFEDGQPDLIVRTETKSDSYEHIIEKRWFIKPDLTITTFEYTNRTYIICGGLNYELTDDEFTLLFDATDKAFHKMVKYRIKARERETINKINNRIEKHKTKKRVKTT